MVAQSQKQGAQPKLTFFKTHPEGVVKVRFQRSISAEQCIEKFDKGLLDGRTLECFLWDGKEDFRKVSESREDLNKRVDDFGQWLVKNSD
mmetsp:Transcript_16139/g.27302  ORF Transcript_16139/g.27302 Transcript_16139/m.27302 type:complete len:90 (+) Transcript_16139:1094-1363(+)